MANRIKGLTVEIDGSTTGLDKALKDVNSTIWNTQTQLKDVQRLLKLDPLKHRAAFPEAAALKGCDRRDQGETRNIKDRTGAGKEAARRGDARAGQVRCPAA